MTPVNYVQFYLKKTGAPANPTVIIAPDNGGSDVFVHISAVERSGLNGLNDGQKISFDEETDPKKGKTSAVNLKAL